MGTPKPITYRQMLARLNRTSRLINLVSFALLWGAFCATGNIIVFGLGLSVSGEEGEDGIKIGDIPYVLALIAVFALVATIIAFIYIKLSSPKRIIDAAFKGENSILAEEDSVLYHVVEEVAMSAGLPKTPKVYLIKNTDVVNAFAISSRNESIVAVTEPLYNLLNRAELQAVVAHEVAHIHGEDSQKVTSIIKTVALVGYLSSVALYIAQFIGDEKEDKDSSLASSAIKFLIVAFSLIFLAVAPALSKLVEYRLSRERESLADVKAVQFQFDPDALAGALVKISQRGSARDEEQRRFNNSVGSVAFFSKKGRGTHPSIYERVSTLVSLGANPKWLDLAQNR